MITAGGPGRVYGARRSDIRPLAAMGATPWPVLPPASKGVDFRSFVPRVEAQGDTSKCLGEAFEDSRRVAVKGKGGLGSPTSVYEGARLRERLRRGDALPDTGCMPADAANHIVAVGFEPWDARDDGGSVTVNDLDTWVEAASARRMSLDDLVVLADGDTDSLERWLTWGALNDHPVAATFVMQVDENYENLTGSSPVWTPGGRVLGGHGQCVVGYSPSDFIVLNSWGTGWGDAGYSYIPRATFAAQASEIILLKGGPVL